MKPYPFSELNHLTTPCDMPSFLLFEYEAHPVCHLGSCELPSSKTNEGRTHTRGLWAPARTTASTVAAAGRPADSSGAISNQGSGQDSGSLGVDGEPRD